MAADVNAQPQVLQSSTGQIVNAPPPPPQIQQGEASETEQKLQQLAQDTQPSAAEAPAQTEGTASTPPSTEAPVQQQQDLSWLDLPRDEQPAAPPTVAPLPDTPEAQKFANQFEEYLGFKIEDLRAGIQEMQQMRQHFNQVQSQNRVQQQESALKQEWGIDGNDFQDRLQVIRERFSKYSPEIQQRLDNVEGAKLIWAKLQQEEQEAGIPVFQKSTGLGRTNAGGNRPQFTRSEILRMSPEQYERFASEITYAYQNNLVLDDLGSK